MNKLIRHLAYQLTRKRIREDALDVCQIFRKREEVSCFSLSTNSILSFFHEGQWWFFRECPRLLPADAYWQEAIRRFFASLDYRGISKAHFSQAFPIRMTFEDPEIQTFQGYLASKISDRRFLNVLQNADRTAARLGFSIWETQQYGDAFFEAFSLADLPAECRDIAVYFLWNMRGAAGSFRMNGLVRGSTHSFFSAVRSAASRIVAEELDLGHLITPVAWCRLVTDDGIIRFGTMSPAAPGSRMLDAPVPPSPALQRELLCLNVLDVICQQPDHGPNNYNAAIHPDGSCGICAFDNDNPQTFFPLFSVHSSLSGCGPMVDRCGQFRRPYMDHALAQRLRELDTAGLARRLQPYLNRLQIAAVCCRIRKLRRAVETTARRNPGFLIAPTQWSSRTVAEEISGKYAETYLTKSRLTINEKGPMI